MLENYSTRLNQFYRSLLALLATASILLPTIVLLLATGCNSNSTNNSTEPPSNEPGVAGDDQLDQQVDAIRIQHKLPALTTVLVHGGDLIEKSAMGFRSANSSEPVTDEDLWHIGSNTKSMTSVLAAMLVENGNIRWDSTLAEVFPELVGTMLIDYEEVRLEELLSHVSGLPHQTSALPGYDGYYLDTRDISIQRMEFVEKALTTASSTTRGDYVYNNVAYTVAGAMLEKVTGNGWENLLEDYLFTNLGMTRTSFGAPATKGILAQPIGHILEDGDWYPVDPSVEEIADNPAVIGPAGTVHTSLEDIAAYMSFHLQGLRKESVAGMLSETSFSKLYTPAPGTQYGLGWNISEQVVYHNGSNNLWYCWISINADKKIALFVATNAADLELGDDSRASKAIFELLMTMGKRADAAFD